MEKRIELEKRGRIPSKIEDLNLDNCKSASIVGLNEEWTSLKCLSLINVGLTSLKGFPCLPALQKLELSDNWISGGLEALSKLPKLMYLNLSGNKITAIDTLKPLKSISTLVNLDLFNCDVSNEEGYRQKVFDLIPSLISLDGFDKDDNEIDEDEEDGEEEAVNNKEEEDGVEDDDDDLDDDIEEEEEDEDDDELDEEEEEDVPLDAIYKNYDPEGDGDYEAGEEEDEEDDIEEEGDDDAAASNSNDGGGGRGKKRKGDDEDSSTADTEQQPNKK